MSPVKIAGEKGEECLEFLKRCLLYGAPLGSPRDLAAYFASYARQARLQLETLSLEDLAPLKTALEAALGVKFQAVDKPGKKLSDEEKAARGDHFFRATLVQTLFYGLFSSWLEHVREKPGQKLDWRLAQYGLNVPMIKTLFSELVKVGNIKALELTRLLELATDCLNRVDQAAFFKQWGDEEAIQYFYEPFLEAFDPQLRKDLGVYYTPPEIVRYMVERVHRTLQSELGLELGLADESVFVLDPCCGTGAFVLETLRCIRKTIQENESQIDNRQRLKDAALKRVFGFEILPAPFVVAHHGVRDLLGKDGIELKEEKEERAPIYLTNALTGWHSFPKTDGMFPEFKVEVEAAHNVKQVEKILVIIGNPPYDAFAKIDEEGDLTGVYKRGLRDEWGVKKWNFNDLYLRFFRIAERKLQSGGRGVLCYISNYSWTSEPSFVVMREHLLSTFDQVWVENMHGNRKISERSPDGKTSETVFSMKGFSPGIQQGVTISLLIKSEEENEGQIAQVFYNDNLHAASAVERRQQLLESLDAPDFAAQYEEVFPAKANRFSLRPRKIGDDYAQWPEVTDLCLAPPSLGLNENRAEGLIGLSFQAMKERMLRYFDPTVSLEDLKREKMGLAFPAALFDPETARRKLLKEEPFTEELIVPYIARPFDIRVCYHTTVAPLWNRSRPVLRDQVWQGNSFFISRKTHTVQFEGAPMHFSTCIGNQDSLRGHAYYFPHFLKTTIATALEVAEDGTMQTTDEVSIRANLSPFARDYLADLGLENPDDNREVGALIWQHALAVGYSPRYREENAGGLSGDWPRIPLPSQADLLRNSAQLGARVGALLDSATPFEGIETGKFLSALSEVGRLKRSDDALIEEGDDALLVTKNWGFPGARGIVQPGDGALVSRAPTPKENEKFEALGLGAQVVVFDVYLSENGFWNGVPVRVWETLIGGYPVLKKWLSYRDQRVLGRALKLEEAREFENIIRRLTLLCAMENELDANYLECASNFVVLSGVTEDADAE